MERKRRFRCEGEGVALMQGLHPHAAQIPIPSLRTGVIDSRQAGKQAGRRFLPLRSAGGINVCLRICVSAYPVDACRITPIRASLTLAWPGLLPKHGR